MCCEPPDDIQRGSADESFRELCRARLSLSASDRRAANERTSRCDPGSADTTRLSRDISAAGVGNETSDISAVPLWPEARLLRCCLPPASESAIDCWQRANSRTSESVS